jgi:predicted nucleic acid-binding protein
MILVVADTGPINYLVQIGAIDVIGRLFDEVVLPGLVQQELMHPKAPQPVRNWAATPPEWVRIQTVAFVAIPKLAPAETEAIALAESLGAFAIIVDDGEGRRVARSKGLRILGTAGILEEAAKSGLVDLAMAFTKLRTTNFRAPPEVLKAALDRDAARRKIGE